MKILNIAVSLVLVFASVSSAFAQQTSVLGPTSIVTGVCNGRDNSPGCVLPGLFGQNGLTLNPNANVSFSHYAHFIGEAQETLNKTLSTAIATQLAILPLISPASGFTYRYDQGSGAFVRTSTSFGPIYAERAETVGRGRFSLGAAYQRFRFDNLDGIDLGKVPAVFAHLPHSGTGGVVQPYEVDVISTSNNIDLHVDQTILYGTVGLTDRLDVSLAVPISSVRLGASSNATILRVSGPTFTPTGAPPTTLIPNPHSFDTSGSLTRTFNNDGSASGIGDVTIRIKGGVLNRDKVRIAAAMDFRMPTGKEEDLLGSGAAAFKPFVAISGTGRFSPHANIGYQWNGKSILAGNITGTTFGEDANGQATLTSGSPTKESLPNHLSYVFGADLGVTDSLTVGFDYLGQTVFDAPRVFRDTLTTAAVPGGTGALTLETVQAGKKTTTLSSGSAGLKYSLYRGLLLQANILFRLDNHGLRQDVTPLLGLSYSFNR